jgi:hypothetical protein
VTFKGPLRAGATAPPAASLLPKGYVVPPITAIEQMGVHGVDPNGPEFCGKPFTQTFVYGYYRGKLTFVEPMVAKSFLESKPDTTTSVRVAAAYSLPSYYPSRYRIGYDPASDQYTIAITGLKAQQMRQ